MPASTSRRSRKTAPVVSLGSLTQDRTRVGCKTCGSSHVTSVAMRLTDGTPVTFTSCRDCEARRWEADGVALSVDEVLSRTRKVS